ncbi:hypothetical protein XELAEV_18043900mg [Xenopus laevis]|uniref:Uncharacterized protein n=1 Tax=Xenopus laevis TaxID=8355 RepID=A0A974H2T0_XENLA|nr:hypothetical protein XELAEV_18043900mg [Xenopus laevis]
MESSREAVLALGQKVPRRRILRQKRFLDEGEQEITGGIEGPRPKKKVRFLEQGIASRTRQSVCGVEEEGGFCGESSRECGREPDDVIERMERAEGESYAAS